VTRDETRKAAAEEPARAAPAPADVALALISHTNAGKTTLARTLLGRDIGEVRDAPHVTAESAAFPLIQTEGGDTLTLWDTPGFGDSVRLAKRLRRLDDPIGWFLSQVWDRFRDRPFWLTQQAMRTVQGEADVVLYLVSAVEEPGDAGYLDPELEVLAWIGKPVLVLLNQTGRPRGAAEEAAEEERWRAALERSGVVLDVLTLDAFARCWAQESTLFAAVGRVLQEGTRPVFGRLVDTWLGRRMEQFEEAMAALAGPIARAAGDRVMLPTEPFTARLNTPFHLRKLPSRDARSQASRDMGARLDTDLRQGMERLIAVHGLEGRAGDVVQERVAADVRAEAPMDEGKTAVVGGVVSGALTGLGADLLAGGLTFGAGMLTGAVLGALGGAGMARGVNVVRGTSDTVLRWEDAFLDGLVTAALLRYLAVAHYGRGRGEWEESEYPPFWRELVVRRVVAHEQTLAAVWELRADDDAVARMETALQDVLGTLALELLEELYPGALDALDTGR
jgi:hypothetical protein